MPIRRLATSTSMPNLHADLQSGDRPLIPIERRNKVRWHLRAPAWRDHVAIRTRRARPAAVASFRKPTPGAIGVALANPSGVVTAVAMQLPIGRLKDQDSHQDRSDHPPLATRTNCYEGQLRQGPL